MPGSELDLAIVGMAGRFPGAPTVDALWENLHAGAGAVTMFSGEEMLRLGVPANVVRREDFVRAASILADYDSFDAPFFGYSSAEAAWLDPQHRVFLECVWEALESAGCNPDAFDGLIGVFAGTSLSSYLLYNLLPTLSGPHAPEAFAVMIANDKDFLATRASYKLNLKGPSVGVQTACSTSLAAVHFAAQALLTYQCDVAVAGGVSIQVPQRSGYIREEGGILSHDGRCRPFDAAASGTVFGSGCGIVVIKRLADATANRDPIRAVIKGTAVNNDGSAKVGFTAPSVDGQARVIAAAHAVADVDPGTIDYIECHGTGTALGDPVELLALTKAFGAANGRRALIGSVKSNIGHLDAAAGVAGVIKTVLSLEHRTIPPTLHFREANPRLDLPKTRFEINAGPVEWPALDHPRRAGVSSFGIGGSNAHVVLEEAPQVSTPHAPERYELLLISAKTESALDAASARMCAFLAGCAVPFADACYTSQTGRKAFAHRRMVVARTAAEAAEALRTRDRDRVRSACGPATPPRVAFMFPGGGAQYPGMAAGLYESEPLFRRELDRSSEFLASLLGFDIRLLLARSATGADAATELIRQPHLGLPALLAVEHALARWWIAAGVTPSALIGHSLGEYTAACLAGIFSIEDALRLVVKRSQLLEQIEKGAMLIVALPEEDIEEMTGGRLSIAAVNGPAQCVVSGAQAGIEAFAAELDGRGLEYRKLHIDTASHSALVEPVLGEFTSFVATLRLSAPEIPCISNVTGEWMRAEEATDPAYWAAHLRQTVQFGRGIKRLLEVADRVLLEAGPGRTLASLAAACAPRNDGRVIVPSMRHPNDPLDDRDVLLRAVGRLWLSGAEIAWTAISEDSPRRRTVLPLYPFERQRYWIDPPKTGRRPVSASSGKNPDITEWFHVPSWESLPVAPPLERVASAGACLLIGASGCDLVGALEDRLRALGVPVVRASFAGTRLRHVERDAWELPSGDREACRELLRAIAALGLRASTIVFHWTRSSSGWLDYDAVASLTCVGQALMDEGLHGVTLRVVSDGMFALEATDRLVPARAPLAAGCKVLPQEIDGLVCQCVDVPSQMGVLELEQLAVELASSVDDRIIALRGTRRWRHRFAPILQTETPVRPLRERGVYLITGGLGVVGVHLAKSLASTYHARLILTSRTAIPDRTQWIGAAKARAVDRTMERRIRAIEQIEALGGEIWAPAVDATDVEGMRLVLSEARARFGAVHGILHAAGETGEAAIRPLSEISHSDFVAAMGAKVGGAAVIDSLSADHALDFVILFSSTAAVLGGLGMLPYAAANASLDAIAEQHRHCGERAWVSANWDGWLTDERTSVSTQFETALQANAMTASESVEAFRRLVSHAPGGQVVVSTSDLQCRVEAWIDHVGRSDLHGGTTVHRRPSIAAAYEPPQSDTERIVADLWKELLGLDEVGAHDNFFDLGGNSLVGVRMINRLRQQLRVDVPILALFEGPTVSALARVIESKGTAKTPEEAKQRGARRASAARRRRATPSTAEV